MRSKRRTLFFVFVILLFGTWFFVVRPERVPPSPDVSIRFDGYVLRSGQAMFTVSNASPVTVAYSGRYHIQLPTDGGWTNQSAAWLPYGAELMPGQTYSFTLSPPDGERRWRMDLDVFAYGYYLGRGRQSINQAGRMIGLSILEPTRYSKTSDLVTKSLAEIADATRKSSESRER
jgi:hypothetical protein